jgi:hypothetical protein
LAYREELLQKSALHHLLKLKETPFAFPNGIRKKQRF